MKSAPSTEFHVGERVGATDWVVRRIVGEGGIGIVLEVAKEPDLRAALKVLHPDIPRSPEFKAQFTQEIQVMGRLRHPNIVHVFDCGVLPDGSPFLLMELLTGRTLRQVVREMPIPFTAKAVRHIVGQICAGLGHAHGDRPPVVHRDIKPDNVFLHGPRPLEGQVKLLDFGLAQVIGPSRSRERRAGTPRYMAPEAHEGGPISPKADLYSLAILVYELLTQGFPWRNVMAPRAMTEAHCSLEPLAPSRWKPWIPPSIDESLLRALSKNPYDRQRTVADFYDELADLEFVDDGSALFRSDVLTAPGLATRARGRLAPEKDSAMEIQRQPRLRPAATGPEIGDARALLADGRARERTGETTSDREGRLRRPATPDGAWENSPASDRARRRVDAPATRVMGVRIPRIRRVVPAALVLGAGALAVAATWGGWKAAHSAPAIDPGSPVALPLAVERAYEAAVERAAATQVRHEATPESAAADAGPLARSATVVASAQAPIDARRAGVPPRRQASLPASAPGILEDMLLAGPPGETAAVVAGGPKETSSGVRSAVPPHGPTGRPAPAPTNLEDILLAGPPPESGAGDAGAAKAKRVIFVDVP
jgi:hypothetical protein